MKKIFSFIVGLLAIASFGIHSSLAHAQTAPVGTPSTATLEQELAVMKATLIDLEMKAGMTPASAQTAPAAAAPATGLSVADRTTLTNALGSLVTALSSLNSSLLANPNATASHRAQIAAVLGGMQKTLVAMNTLAAGGSAMQGSAVTGSTGGSAPIAANTGSGSSAPAMPAQQTPTPAPIASNQPAPQPSNPEPSTGSLAPSAAPTAGSNGNQTAQASGAWGFVTAHWPTITIIILVALILLILFWPSGEEGSDKHHAEHSSKPQAPNRPVVVTTPIQASQSSTPTATPMATVAVAPSQKIDVQQSKVTVIRPPQQQKKPA